MPFLNDYYDSKTKEAWGIDMKTLTQSTNTDLSYDTGLELANLYHLHYHHAGKPSFCTLFFLLASC